QVLLAGQQPVDRRELPGHADRRAYRIRFPGRVVPSDPDVATVRAGQRRQDLHHGGLAGTVRAQQREDRALRDGEIYAVEDHVLAVRLAQSAYRDRRPVRVRCHATTVPAAAFSPATRRQRAPRRPARPAGSGPRDTGGSGPRTRMLSPTRGLPDGAAVLVDRVEQAERFGVVENEAGQERLGPAAECEEGGHRLVEPVPGGVRPGDLACLLLARPLREELSEDRRLGLLTRVRDSGERVVARQRALDLLAVAHRIELRLVGGRWATGGRRREPQRHGQGDAGERD